MLRVLLLLVLMCCSVTKANIIILARNVETNDTTLAFEDDELTGPFITVGDDISHEMQSAGNSTLNDYAGGVGDPDDPDNSENEEYDDYDFSQGHLHASTLQSEDATEPKPSNFPPRRRKNTKKRNKRPKRPLSPNRRVKRPTGITDNRKKRIRIKTNKRIQPVIVSQFINDLRKNCPMCECGVQTSARRHMGRKKSSLQLDFPWLVHLSYFGRLYCAGTLINDRYIVTAGHCTKGYITRMITVRLTDNQSVGLARRVEKVFRPPSYDTDTLDDDIAVLKISTPLPIDEVTPICLPLKGSSFAGKNGIVAGRGLSLLRGNEPVNVLRKAIVPILSNKRCKRKIGGHDLSQRMICVGNRQTNACQVLSKGDGGGPLVAKQRGRFRLAGVASHQQTCGQRNEPGIYTRVSKYSTWISQLTQDACWCRE